MLNEKILIIYIDQSFVNRRIEDDESWEFKGVETEAKTVPSCTFPSTSPAKNNIDINY